MSNSTNALSSSTIDPMGQAVYDFHFNQLKDSLLVLDEFGPPVPMDVSYYFRSYKKMPILEQEALKQCHGKILDVGAGAGSHSLYLQDHSLDITALDISKNNCAVIKDRGVQNVIHQSIWEHPLKEYDTLLFMMNGLGFVGTVPLLQSFLSHLYQLTNEHVQLIADSSDVYYLFDNRPRPKDHYYGEINCRYSYDDLLSSTLR